MKKIHWIVIPGGPGLSKQYLKEPLTQAFVNENLYFYDTLGSPELPSKELTIEAMVAQIFQVAKENNLEFFGLITHSFGNYLAMRLMAETHHPVEAIIMLNPMPFRKDLYQNGINHINSRISESDLNDIQALSQKLVDGSSLFRKLYPYYVGNKNAALSIEVPFNLTTCNDVLSQLPDYDDTACIDSCSIPLVQIAGECDPFFNERTILSKKTITIPGVGHFPFLEDPLKFSAAASTAIRMIYQNRILNNFE